MSGELPRSSFVPSLCSMCKERSALRNSEWCQPCWARWGQEKGLSKPEGVGGEWFRYSDEVRAVICRDEKK
jgi:hypothetical protein